MNQQGEPYKVLLVSIKNGDLWRHRDVYHYDLKSFEDFVIASPDDLVFDDIAFGSSQIIEQNKWQHF